MTPQFFFTFKNVEERTMTDYQRLMLYYIIGRISFNGEAPPSIQCTIDRDLSVKYKDFNEIPVRIVFRNISADTLKVYLAEYPFASDAKVFDGSGGYGHNGGIYMQHREICITPISIQRFSIE